MFAESKGNNLRGVIRVWIYFLRKGTLDSKTNLSLFPCILEEAKAKQELSDFG